MNILKANTSLERGETKIKKIKIRSMCIKLVRYKSKMNET